MTLFYPDVSNNNWGSTQLTVAGQQALQNFLSQLRQQGFAGVSHKMSQGSDFIDPYGALCQSWCDDNDFPFIGYHYVDESDPGAQAANWRAAGGRDNTMFDHEDGSGDMDNFWAVTNGFNAAGVNVALGYIPHWYIGNQDLSGLSANGIYLISSGYPMGYAADYASTLYDSCGGDTGSGWAPYNGATPTAWQFTSSAIIAGVSGVDCNAYLGTDLNVLFGGTPASGPGVSASAPLPPSPTPPPPLGSGAATNLFGPAPDPTLWELPTDDSIFSAASDIVAQFLGSATTGGTNA